MKKLFLIITFITTILFSTLVAAQPTASIAWPFPKSEDIESNLVYQLDYSLYRNLSLCGSYEKTLLRYGGQELADLRITSFGFRVDREYKGITLSIGVGYYHPDVKMRSSSDEALSIEMSGIVGNTVSVGDAYQYDLKGALGGNVLVGTRVGGLFDVFVGYRLLKFQEVIICRAERFGTGHWETFKYRDYSGPFVGVRYSF